MKCRIAALLVLTLFSFIVTAQTPKTLLWRISGKGLKQPSYLFGTMHLTDKRLFRLGDSLFNAIENTQGFAMEINPDEMAAYMLNNIYSDEKSRTIKDILSKEAYDKYSEELSKRLNKPASEITSQDILREKNKWLGDYLEKGEMPTFMDAFLYNIAKRQGKWVGGVEDLADQMGLLEDLVDESDIIVLLGDEQTATAIKRSFDELKRVYINEDLDAIEYLTSNVEHRDAILINRNIKMARRMDSLSAIRTTFFAIGAAHLPGDSGVISLLQKTGFTVEPVMSSKKIDASKYTFKEVELPWVTVTDTISFYTVSMPSQPTDVDVMGIINMKFLLDIPSTSGYCTMAFGNPSPGLSDEEMIASVAKNFMQKKKMGSPKTIERNGLKIIEYRQSAADAKMRLQFFVKNKIVYMAMMYGPKKDAINSEQANRFFNSYTPLAPIEKRNTIAFSDRNKDITFNTPVRMNLNKAMSQEDDGSGWKVSTYMGSDIKAGSFYLFLERKVNPGYYLDDFSSVLKNFKEGVSEQISDIRFEGDLSFKNGKGYYVKGTSAKNGGFITHLLYTFRDNRMYMFSAVGDADDEPAFDEFFKSIEFLPYKNAALSIQTSPDSLFTTTAPSPLEWNYSSDSSTRQIMSFDENSSTCLFLLTDTLSKYYWVESEDSLWSSKIKYYDSGDDSVVSINDTWNGKIKGKEIWILRPGGSYNRIRMFRDSTILYFLSAYAQKENLTSETVNKFYNDFRFTHPLRSYDVTASRINELISALSDSTTNYTAYQALIAAKFSNRDIPLLEDALFRSYGAVYEYTNMPYINHSIADQLVKLKGNSTVEKVVTRYLTFTHAQNAHKWIALALLAKWNTKESYDHILQLLSKYERPFEYDYEFFSALGDNLDRLAPVYADFLKLMPDTTFSLPLTRMGIELIDSGLIEKKWFIENEKLFEDLATFYINRNKNNTDSSYDYELYSLIEMLEKIGTPEAKRSLYQFVTLNILYLKREAAISLLKLGEKVDASVFIPVAADRAFRVSLYDQLKELNRLDLFPKTYATQKAMAEGEAWSIATDDDSPSDLTYIGERIATLGGKKYKFYLFKVTYEYEDERSEYLAVAGGFDLDPKNIYVSKYLGSIYFEKEYDGKKVNEFFKEWLAQEEKYLQDYGDEDDKD